MWIAALASNVGTWMHEVGANWLMTDLAPSPTLVALVTAAATFPRFLLSVPAGALADVVERRKILLWAQAAMLAAALTLTLLALTSSLSPGLLLAMTLLLGAGAALSDPAYQTLMTDLAPRDQLPQASALNSVSLNLSRAVGPAIGGIVVAQFGPWATFALNAASFVGIVLLLARSRGDAVSRAATGERFVGAVRAGVRYVRHSSHMRGVLVRTTCFVLFASCLWALMPLVARERLGMGAKGYGLVLATLGLGALAGAMALATLRQRMSLDALVALASVLYAAAMVVFGLVRTPWIALAAMLIAGGAWLTMVVCLNASAQSGAPPWVRGRALAFYLTIFYGFMSAGSALWGFTAERLGLDAALLAAAIGLVLGLSTLAWYRLRLVDADEHRKSDHWADPVVAHPVHPDDGPVVITIEYLIRDEDVDAFRDAMAPVSTTRYRDGAVSWLLSRDTEDPRKWLEVFMVESWGEHLRQHDRVTIADREVQERAKVFHLGPDKPAVRHFIASSPGAAQPKPVRPAIDHRA
jgi:MFS family permease/quinol monooxygenase YgiN